MGEAPEQMVLVETAEDVETPRGPRPEQGRLSDADDAQRRRRQHRHRGAPEEVPADRQPAQGRHLLRHAEPPGGRPRAGRARPTWCSCWAARTARTASGWPRSPTSLGIPSHLIDGVSEIRPEWFDGVETVLITAGASAPGGRRAGVHRVSRDATTARRCEEAYVREENVHFPLPEVAARTAPGRGSCSSGQDGEE